jgi:methyl-accepting chemotaxis protein
MQQLGKSADLSTRVSVGGNDELAALGTEMNRMLDSLENSRHDLIKRGEMLDKKTGELENTVADLTKTTTELKAAKTVLEEKMKELEEFHELAVGRELKMIELEKEIERLKREGKI